MEDYDEDEDSKSVASFPIPEMPGLPPYAHEDPPEEEAHELPVGPRTVQNTASTLYFGQTQKGRDDADDLENETELGNLATNNVHDNGSVRSEQNPSHLEQIADKEEFVSVPKNFLRQILNHLEEFTLKGELIHSHIHSVLYDQQFIARRELVPVKQHARSASEASLTTSDRGSDDFSNPKKKAKKERGPYMKVCPRCGKKSKQKPCEDCAMEVGKAEEV